MSTNFIAHETHKLGGWEAAGAGEEGYACVCVRDREKECVCGGSGVLYAASFPYQVVGLTETHVRGVEEVLSLISVGNKARYIVCAHTHTHTQSIRY